MKSCNVLSNTPDSDLFVLLGDYNARIGSRDAAQDQWGMARGPHGHGIDNDAGKELLSFLTTHQVTACNTLFQKKNIHLTTWKHPKSQNWYCVDYSVMRRDMDWSSMLHPSSLPSFYCPVKQN